MSSIPTLYIGNKAYSSWSLRVWWTLKLADLPFNLEVIPLDGAGGSEQRKASTRLKPYSPAAKVPVLHTSEGVIWDSMSIIEYASEKVSQGLIWPLDPYDRAMARSVAADIHGGCAGLGSQVVFNCRRTSTKLKAQPDAQRDIDRLVAMWSHCINNRSHTGDFLLGPISAADTVSAPLLSIISTYGFEVPSVIEDYMNNVLSHPLMQQWITDAKAEPWLIAEYEHG